MPPRSRKDGWLALGLLVALVGGVLVLGTAGSKETDPFEIRRSTYLTTPHGTKALHDLLQELGYDVRRHRGPAASKGAISTPSTRSRTPFAFSRCTSSASWRASIAHSRRKIRVS